MMQDQNLTTVTRRLATAAATLSDLPTLIKIISLAHAVTHPHSSTDANNSTVASLEIHSDHRMPRVKTQEARPLGRIALEHSHNSSNPIITPPNPAKITPALAFAHSASNSHIPLPRPSQPTSSPTESVSCSSFLIPEIHHNPKMAPRRLRAASERRRSLVNTIWFASSSGEGQSGT